MSKRLHRELDAIAKYLPDGELKFLRCLVDMARDDGSSVFPRRKTLVARTGKSRRWLEVLERRFVARGWLARTIVGAGCRRRTFYQIVRLPSADELTEVSVAQLRLPFEAQPVNVAVENLCMNVEADRIQYDPQIVFAREIAFLSAGDHSRLAAPVDLDPQVIGSNVRTKEEKAGARAGILPSWLFHPGGASRAQRNLKARLEVAAERRRVQRVQLRRKVR